MKMNWETVYVILFKTLYTVLLILMIMTLVKIIKKVNKTNELFKIYLCYIFFILTNLFCTFFSFSESNFKFLLFISFELILLVSINKVITPNKILKNIVYLFFLLTYILAFIIFSIKNKHIIYVLISVSTSLICMNYFNDIKNKLNTKFILQNPKTIIILGLFFCYGVTFPVDVTAAYLHYMNKINLTTVSKNTGDIISNIYDKVSYLEILSYFILNFSINKSLNFTEK